VGRAASGWAKSRLQSAEVNICKKKSTSACGNKKGQVQPAELENSRVELAEINFWNINFCFLLSVK